MSGNQDNPSFISREQVIEAYLKAFQLIDHRVAPLLGQATTRVVVQGAAKRLSPTYPFLGLLTKMDYSEIVPAILHEQLSGISIAELAKGLDALLQECFAGLKELTGNLIVPPLHEEVTRQLEQKQ